MSTLAKKKRISDQHTEDKKYLLANNWTCQLEQDTNTEIWSHQVPKDEDETIVRTFRQAYKIQVRWDGMEE